MKPRLFQKYAQWGYQGGRRCWCLEMMPEVTTVGRREEYALHNYPTWEHVIPQAKKGTSQQDNLVLAHYHCNKERGTEFRIPHFRSYVVVTEPFE